MVLRYFAAIAPPAEISEGIVAFAEKNLREEIRPKIAPHVTAFTQYGMDPSLVWESVAAQVAASTKPFTVTMGEPEFISEFLLGIPVHSPELSEMHDKAVKLLAPEEPEEAEMHFATQAVFNPFITLGNGVFGTWIEKRRVLGKAKGQFKGVKSFQVSALQLYEAVVFGSTYDLKKTLPLGKPNGSEAELAGSLALA